MASRKEYLVFILDQLSQLKEISWRAMMGEYIIYYKGVIIGGIYDDRFLVKQLEKAEDYMESVSYALPYEGAKEMLLVDNVESKEYLAGLVNTIYNEIQKKGKKR